MVSVDTQWPSFTELLDSQSLYWHRHDVDMDMLESASYNLLQAGHVPAWMIHSIFPQAVDESTSSIAFGCKGSELSVWTMKGERTYLGKAAKPNRIGLVDKPWNTALAFLPSSRGKQIIVGTGQHKVRVYNLEQRRPKLSIDFGEAKITALAPQPDGEDTGFASRPELEQQS